MNNKERFRLLMSGAEPDITPFLIFSELLPGNVFQEQLRQHDIGLIVHAGSVHTRTEYPVHDEISQGIRRQTATTPYGTCYAEYRTGHANISGNGEIQKSYWIKSPADYAKVVHMLDNTHFDLDSATYMRALDRLGEDGVTHTWCDEPPYMGLQYLLGYEKWCLDQYDVPDLFQELMEAYERLQTRRMTLQMEAPERDLICIGNLSGNYAPARYEIETKPYFDLWGAKLAANGCSVTIHADAINLSKHLDVFPSPGVSVAEAFTPPPTGDLSLLQARRAWGDQLVFHINVPEAIFYMGHDYITAWTKQLLDSDPNPRRFLSFTENGLLGVSGAKLDLYMNGILAICEAIHERTRQPVDTVGAGEL